VKFDKDRLRALRAALTHDDMWAARSIIFEEHCATSDERPFRALMAFDKLSMIADQMPGVLDHLDALERALAEACDIASAWVGESLPDGDRIAQIRSVLNGGDS